MVSDNHGSDSNSKKKQLKELLSQIPDCITPVYSHDEPNEPIPLYSGNGSLSFRQRDTDADLEFFFEWARRPATEFEATVEGHPGEFLNPSGSDKKVVKVDELGIDCPFVTRQSQYRLPRNQFSVRGGFDQALLAGTPSSIDALVFHIPNFYNYHGKRVQTAKPGNTKSWAGRLDLDGGEYRITVDRLGSYDNEKRRELKRAGGYRLTHVGQAQRKDGDEFTATAATDLLTELHYFFSFLRGAWCGPILATGFKNGDRQWSYWDHSPLLSEWRAPISWFPANEPTGAGDLLSEFRSLFADSLWNEALRHVIHWYCEADGNAGGLEGSIVLIQTALERLSWAYLVEDKKKYGSGQFDSWPASKRFSELLTDLGIPDGLPSYPPEIQKVADTLNANKGTEVFARLRNSIVHPEPGNRSKIQGISPTQRNRVKQLGLEYLELSLLSLMGYDGVFESRIRRRTGMESPIDVPWS